MNKKQYWMDILERTLWTFLEGFIAALCATAGMGMDNAGWRIAIATALAAGFSACKTVIVNGIRIYKERYLKIPEVDDSMEDDLK